MSEQDRECDERVSDGLIASPAPAGRKRKPPEQLSQKGRDYVVACFSIYPETVRAMDSMLAELAAAGVRGMTKSRLIREALSRVDLRALADELVAQGPAGLPVPTMSATVHPGKITSRIYVHGEKRLQSGKERTP